MKDVARIFRMDDGKHWVAWWDGIVPRDRRFDSQEEAKVFASAKWGAVEFIPDPLIIRSESGTRIYERLSGYVPIIVRKEKP